MYYVYVLQSQLNGDTYVGYSTNLKRRLREHLYHKVRSTAHLQEIELVHYEAYKSNDDAHRREKYLKTTQGKRMLKIMLRYSLSKIKNT
jgi:putative endonuclease